MQRCLRSRDAGEFRGPSAGAVGTCISVKAVLPAHRLGGLARLPIVFAFVLTFAFLLLMASFRSIVIAAKAVILNLLSVAAAYGVVVAVFQYGWGQHLLNFKSNGAIAPWLPMFMFVLLFGLSMDYHVFILTRVREAFDRGMSTEDAVEHGIKTTAGTVTSAAIVMVGAFAIFATLPILEMKEMGIGLAAAVLIDATIVRGVLLPASMKLLGDWNWYLPNWLRWLPKARTPHRAHTRAGASSRLKHQQRRRYQTRAAPSGPGPFLQPPPNVPAFVTGRSLGRNEARTRNARRAETASVALRSLCSPGNHGELLERLGERPNRSRSLVE
jgi:hypothetical protein